MSRTLRRLAPLAAAVPMALVPVAGAHAADGDSYSATLNQLNGSGGSGMVTVTLDGDQATVNLSYSGLASTFMNGPFPHVQHIHIGAQGVCPTPSADKNGDGVVSTPEAQSSYGMIGTTLSTKGGTGADQGTNIKVAPGGSSTDYSRTFTMNADTRQALQDGTGVVVVHGLDPSTLSKKAQNEKSPLVPSLPLAATAPALCGSLSSMPSGGVATGTGSTSGTEHLGLLAGGGALAAAGVASVLVMSRRRRSADAA